jgi:hypothetical protein
LISVLLIDYGQEQGNLNPWLGQGSHRDRSPPYRAEKCRPPAIEGGEHQSLPPKDRAASPSIADPWAGEVQERLHGAALREDNDQEPRTRSERSAQSQSTHSKDREHAGNDRKGISGRGRRPKARGTSGTCATGFSEAINKLPPKQSSEVWYCHLNCQYPGPWRSQVSRCIGCQHDRCGLCEEEVVVTRDPSAPRS